MSVYVLLVLDLCTWSTNKYNNNNTPFKTGSIRCSVYSCIYISLSFRLIDRNWLYSTAGVNSPPSEVIDTDRSNRWRCQSIDWPRNARVALWRRRVCNCNLGFSELIFYVFLSACLTDRLYIAVVLLTRTWNESNHCRLGICERRIFRIYLHQGNLSFATGGRVIFFSI